MEKSFAFLVTIAVLSMADWAWQTKAADEPAMEVFPYHVRVEIGDAEFLPGDSIAIEEVRGTSDIISIGQTYRVTGTYNLASRDEAMLSFYVTATSGSG